MHIAFELVNMNTKTNAQDENIILLVEKDESFKICSIKRLWAFYYMHFIGFRWRRIRQKQISRIWVSNYTHDISQSAMTNPCFSSKFSNDRHVRPLVLTAPAVNELQLKAYDCYCFFDFVSDDLISPQLNRCHESWTTVPCADWLISFTIERTTYHREFRLRILNNLRHGPLAENKVLFTDENEITEKKELTAEVIHQYKTYENTIQVLSLLQLVTDEWSSWIRG